MATSGSTSYLNCFPSPSPGLPPIPPSENLPVNNNSDGTGNKDGNGDGNGNGHGDGNRDGEDDGEDDGNDDDDGNDEDDDNDADDANGADQGGADQGFYMDFSLHARVSETRFYTPLCKRKYYLVCDDALYEYQVMFYCLQFYSVD